METWIFKPVFLYLNIVHPLRNLFSCSFLKFNVYGYLMVCTFLRHRLSIFRSLVEETVKVVNRLIIMYKFCDNPPPNKLDVPRTFHRSHSLLPIQSKISNIFNDFQIQNVHYLSGNIRILNFSFSITSQILSEQSKTILDRVYTSNLPFNIIWIKKFYVSDRTLIQHLYPCSHI